MTRSKALTKVLSLVATGAMTFGMVLPVVAEGDDKKVTQAWISKTYNTAVGKAEEFSFESTPVTGENLITSNLNLTIPNIGFLETNIGTTTTATEIHFPDYDEAGQYEYIVKESQTATPEVTENDHEKLIMSQAEYTVDVYVINTDAGCKISNIIVNKSKDDKGIEATGKVANIDDKDKTGFNFTNTYTQEAGTGDNPGTDYLKDGSFNVTKIVKATNNGTIDSTKVFNFTATFNLPEGTDASTFGGIKGNEAEITTLKSTGDRSYSCTFELTNGKNMKFTGLPVGTSVCVTESAAPNYKGSYKLTLNGVEGETVSIGKYNVEYTIGGTGTKLGKAKNTADVTNTYNYVPTTGIIMNSLPYVMMFGVGTIALVLYVSSKHRKMSD